MDGKIAVDYVLQLMGELRAITVGFMDGGLNAGGSALNYFGQLQAAQIKKSDRFKEMDWVRKLDITKDTYEKLREDAENDANKESRGKFAAIQVVGENKTDQINYLKDVKERLDKEGIPSFVMMPVTEEHRPAHIFVAQKNASILDRARMASLIAMGKMSFCTDKYDLENSTRAKCLLDIGEKEGLSDVELYTFSRTLKQLNKASAIPACVNISADKHIFYRLEDRATVEFALQLTRSRLMGKNALQYGAESEREKRQDIAFANMALAKGQEKYIVSAKDPGHYIKITETGFEVYEPGLSEGPAERIFAPEVQAGSETWSQEIKEGARALYTSKLQSEIARISAPVALVKEKAVQFKHAHVENDKSTERLSLIDERKAQQTMFGQIQIEDRSAQILQNAFDVYDAAVNTEKELSSIEESQTVPESTKALVEKYKQEAIQTIMKINETDDMQKVMGLIEKDQKDRREKSVKYNDVKITDVESFIEETDFDEHMTPEKAAEPFISKNAKLYTIEDMMKAGLNKERLDDLTKERLSYFEDHGLDDASRTIVDDLETNRSNTVTQDIGGQDKNDDILPSPYESEGRE